MIYFDIISNEHKILKMLADMEGNQMSSQKKFVNELPIIEEWDLICILQRWRFKCNYDKGRSLM